MDVFLPEPTNLIRFKPVNTENWVDFESFFQSRRSYCWCMAWRMTPEERKENNAGCRKEFMRQRILSGSPVGILGYINDQPIAWCSVAPRETYQRLGGEEDLKNVWSIACFYISKEFRKRGIVGELVENAKEYAKSNGAKYLEAYPVEPDSPSYRFMGFIGTFEKVGFKQVKMAGSRRHVMILPL
jgi:GNAT superfamily N-acetyltransferase